MSLVLFISFLKNYFFNEEEKKTLKVKYLGQEQPGVWLLLGNYLAFSTPFPSTCN